MKPIKGVLTGLAWVNLEDIPPARLNLIMDAYSYPIPHEPDMEPFKTFVLLSTRIGLPYGNKIKLLSLLPGLELEDRRIAPSTEFSIKLTGLTLKDYQDVALQEIVEYFNSGETTFNLAGKAGSGKSVLMAGILAKLGIKTLVIAHLSMLTSQLAKEFHTFTESNISVLSATNDTLKDVNISTSQLISKRPELWKRIKHEIGCIIIDESETAGSLTTLRILQRSHARYRIFVSATFSRSTDRRTEALRDIAGNKVITLTRPDLLVPAVMMVYCNEMFPEFYGKHRFVRDKQAFFRKQSILNKVMYIVEKSLQKGRYILIATDIIEMQEYFRRTLGAGVLNGKTKKAEREDILERFNNGTLRVITGASVLTAGLSMPRVSTIVRVSFPKSPEKSVQLAGRALRDFEGKQGAWIFDMVYGGQDPEARVEAYKENGYKVTNHSWDVLKEKL